MSTFEAGFARIDITPPIGSTGQTNEDGDREIVGVYWPLNARVAVFAGSAGRTIFISCDLVALETPTVDEIRAAIAEATSFDASAILITCTHTHSSARTLEAWSESGADREYLAELPSKIARAAVNALDSLAPAELRVGSTQTSGLTFNRRPVYTGGEVGNEGPQWVDDFVEMEGPADESLQVLYAVRPDGSIAGGMVNFAVHPHMFGLEPVYSADFAGAFVTKLGAAVGGEFLFLQGASGNLYWRDMTKPPFWTVEGGAEPGSTLRTVAPWGQREAGEWGPIALADKWSNALVDGAHRAMADSRPITPGPVRILSARPAITQRRPKPEHLEAARWLLEQDLADVDVDAYNQRATGHRYTFYDNNFLQTGFAHQILNLHAKQQSAGVPEVIDEAEVMAITLGDVAFASYPAEMFTEFGLRTKSESPYTETFVVQLANGISGYIPTAEAFEHGGYETRIAVQSRYAETTGDELTDTAVRLLHSLAEDGR